jgi:hypothetical protein
MSRPLFLPPVFFLYFICYDNREEFLRERDLFFPKVLSPQKNRWVMESSTFGNIRFKPKGLTLFISFNDSLCIVFWNLLMASHDLAVWN